MRAWWRGRQGQIEEEIGRLKGEAERLATEIGELTGTGAVGL